MSPYILLNDLKRFDQRYTSFARAGWDPSCAAYGKRARPREEIAASGRPGYTREDFALHVGARAMDGQIGEYRKAHGEDRYADRYEPADWGAFTERLKHAARLYGASTVGVARVNPLWVYASDGQGRPVELPEGMHSAVVMAIEMDYDLIRTAPSVMSAAGTGNGYSRMAFTAVCLARYLTELGWRALPSGNDAALSIPLAVDAGLGELGRNGLLITPLYGPRVRLCKVFTDAPLVPGEPISFGVEAFCDVCMKCADTCPSRSIPRGGMTDSGPTASNNPGVRKWYINPDQCLAFWRENGIGCANCIRSCPFNKLSGWIHGLARRVIRARSRRVNRGLVFMDDLCGYG